MYDPSSYSKELDSKPKNIRFQIVLLGDADEIVHHLCEQLQWGLPPPPNPKGGIKVPQTQTNGKRTSSDMIGWAEPTRVQGR